MINRVLLTCLPLMAWATYLDPSLQQQKPLLDAGGQPSTAAAPAAAAKQDVILPLTWNNDLEYSFPAPNLSPNSNPESTSTNTRILLSSIFSTSYPNNVHAGSRISISIPLDASAAGSISFSSSSSHSSSALHPDLLFPLPQTAHASHRQKAKISLYSIGVRRGGMLGMPVSGFAPLDLADPFIRLPREMWNVLVLAAKPTLKIQARGEGEEIFGVEGQMWSVECEGRGRLPDLVFGVRGVSGEGVELEQEDGDGGDEERMELRKRDWDGDEEEGEYDGEVQELVVTPAQYVMQTVDGECLLLAREAAQNEEEDGGVVLGWAAMRGRQVVFDFEQGVMSVEL